MIVSREKVELSNPNTVSDQLWKILEKEDSISRAREHFWVIHLNVRNKVKFIEVISIGTANSSLVHPREVFRRAIKKGSISIILAHNHPSGDPEPSSEDITITKRITEAGKIIGIEVLDHVVLGVKTFSFKEKGLM